MFNSRISSHLLLFFALREGFSHHFLRFLPPTGRKHRPERSASFENRERGSRTTMRFSFPTCGKFRLRTLPGAQSPTKKGKPHAGAASPLIRTADLRRADYSSNECITTPERSLGSNQVVFGGMILPVSAMWMSWDMETG